MVSADAKEIVYVSPAYEKIWGRSCESLYQSPGDWTDAIHPDDRPRVLAGMAAAALGTPYEDRFRILRPDGSTRWIQIRGFPIRDEGGNVYRITGVSADVTDQHEAEEALHVKETFLRHVVDLNPALIFAKDHEGRFTLANQAIARMYGTTVEELLGKRDADFTTDPAEAEAFLQADRAAIESQQEQFIAEERVTGPDGKITYLQTIKRPLQIGRDGQRLVLGVSTDITLRKRAEEGLRLSLAAEEHSNKRASEAMSAAMQANRLKSEFLANMSHEIRTPMTAILGYADLLLTPGQTASDRLNNVNTIRRNGAHLLTIVNDVLDISKIEAGEMMPEHVPCSPCRIVGEVASTMRVRASEKRLGFEVRVDGRVPETIQSDPTRLRQVLINLAGNAIKFTATGCIRIVLRCERAESDAPRMIFEVIDTGIGMTATHLEKIFNPFTQADNSTTRKFGGTGLGLTISRRLAQILGGDITVTSDLHRGSVFTCTIDPGPLKNASFVTEYREAAIEHASEAEPEATPIRGRILLAEDGLDNRFLLESFLRGAGAEVEVAENGQLAHDAVLAAEAAGRPFDVILMDMQMPLLDGYGATAKLRARGIRTPIIALTAHAMAHDRAKCLNSGCTDFLTKPTTRKALIAMVLTHLPSGGETSAGSAPTESSPAADPAGERTASVADDPDVLRFMPMFLERLPAQVAAMSQALEAAEMSTLRSVLHQLKGSAGMYGFPSVVALAGRAEEMVDNNALLEQLAVEVSEIVATVRGISGYDLSRERQLLRQEEPS